MEVKEIDKSTHSSAPFDRTTRQKISRDIVELNTINNGV